MKKYTQDQVGVPTLFYQVCDRNPEKTCFIDVIGDRYWSFNDVDKYSNKIANYFLSLGYQPGDCVAILMESGGQYVATWLGLAKIGVVPALLNYNLRLDSLAHCLHAAEAKSLIYSSVFRGAIEEAQSLLPPSLSQFELGDSVKTYVDDNIEKTSAVRPPLLRYNFNSPLIYIYTSGTTGLPKAAKVVHSRYFYMANTLYNFGGMNSTTIIYDTLPIYHSAGGILGVGQALLQGCTVVIRKKFSASNFWADCIKYNCTAAQYIGEICRYLLAQEHKLVDTQHKVSLVYGNGLKPQIWREFKTRFNLKKIAEFYGATEGNANAINIDNTEGCVGFTSVIIPSFHPISVIKVAEDGSAIRGNNGLCIRADPGEPGELVGKISNTDSLNRFDGYSTKEATSKKIVSDVFTRGDNYFLTGDVVAMDELGYLYFKDRTGDTFRWKGENVSTAEVEARVSNVINMMDAVAFGVEVPGAEGKAGMVAIEDPDRKVDVSSLYKSISMVLPAYARPIFVRILQSANKTSTFKLQKVELRKEGFNPSLVSDQMYYLNAKQGQYLPLTLSVYEDIQKSRIRF
ncbi:SLC27A4 [Bugula neritina]|uniref:Very long-chain fatty acid transport protein n=1 Tax=Bugula neritina TaxID=10212 RepID=A0A7J7KK38_BUGNE|nr:SLC27A4 [Bugula neritina]